MVRRAELDQSRRGIGRRSAKGRQPSSRFAWRHVILREASSEMNASISGIHVRSAGLHRRTCKFNGSTPERDCPKSKLERTSSETDEPISGIRRPRSELNRSRLRVRRRRSRLERRQSDIDRTNRDRNCPRSKFGRSSLQTDESGSGLRSPRSESREAGFTGEPWWLEWVRWVWTLQSSASGRSASRDHLKLRVAPPWRTVFWLRGARCGLRHTPPHRPAFSCH